MEGVKKYDTFLTPDQQAFVEDDRKGCVAWIDHRSAKSMHFEVGQLFALTVVAADCVLSSTPTYVAIYMRTCRDRQYFMERLVSMITPFLDQHNANIDMWNMSQYALDVSVTDDKTATSHVNHIRFFNAYRSCHTPPEFKGHQMWLMGHFINPEDMLPTFSGKFWEFVSSPRADYTRIVASDRSFFSLVPIDPDHTYETPRKLKESVE